MSWYWWIALIIGGWFVAMFTFAMGSIWKDKREQTRAYVKKMAQQKDETL
jgi:phosphate/sulfate permease